MRQITSFWDDGYKMLMLARIDFRDRELHPNGGDLAS
jgi:hypothetical protein